MNAKKTECFICYCNSSLFVRDDQKIILDTLHGDHHQPEVTLQLCTTNRRRQGRRLPWLPLPVARADQVRAFLQTAPRTEEQNKKILIANQNLKYIYISNTKFTYGLCYITHKKKIIIWQQVNIRWVVRFIFSIIPQYYTLYSYSGVQRETQKRESSRYMY